MPPAASLRVRRGAQEAHRRWHPSRRWRLWLHSGSVGCCLGGLRRVRTDPLHGSQPPSMMVYRPNALELRRVLLPWPELGQSPQGSCHRATERPECRHLRRLAGQMVLVVREAHRARRLVSTGSCRASYWRTWSVWPGRASTWRQPSDEKPHDTAWTLYTDAAERGQQGAHTCEFHWVAIMQVLN